MIASGPWASNLVAMGTRDGRWVVTLLLAGTFLLAAEDEEVVLRKDIFSRKTDGYHTYRIPTMVVTGKGTILVFVEGRKTHRRPPLPAPGPATMTGERVVFSHRANFSQCCFSPR